MKLLIAVFSLFLLLTSCKSDDVDSPSQSEAIVGTWHLADFYSDSLKTIVDEEIVATTVLKGSDYNQSLTFTSGYKYTLEGSFKILWETTLKDGTQTSGDIPTDADNLTGIWSIDGNTLTVGGPEGGDKFEIVELTNTKLVLKQAVVDAEIGEEGFEMTGNIFQTWEK